MKQMNTCDGFPATVRDAAKGPEDADTPMRTRRPSSCFCKIQGKPVDLNMRCAPARIGVAGSSAYEVMFALQYELNLDQQKALALRFADHLLAGEGLPFTLAIHVGGEDKRGSPHCP